MLRAQDPLLHGQQRSEQISAGGQVPRLPGPAGELAAGTQGVRMLRAEDPLVDGQQRGEQVAGGGRITRHPCRAGEVTAGGQEVRVLRAEDPFPRLNYSAMEIPGGSVTAAPAKIIGHPGRPVAVVGESRLGVR